MELEAISFDQVRVFVTVADHGSFSAAARVLGRAQSAVTYAIQRLEEQSGTPFFDRTAYRPTLTEAGRTLLSRARRIVEEVNGFRAQARGLAGGLESELSLVVDSLFPMARFVTALRAFSVEFPSVTPRIYVESLGASTQLVLDGTCVIGLVPSFFSESDVLRKVSLVSVALVPVVAPSHPLGQWEGSLEPEMVRDHTQLVLTDRSGLTGNRDYGVFSAQTWRLADLGAKHAMLLEGLGWGNMPSHLVEEDLRQGRLKRLSFANCQADSDRWVLYMSSAHRADRPLGPAARWMLDHLAAHSELGEGEPVAPFERPIRATG